MAARLEVEEDLCKVAVLTVFDCGEVGGVEVGVGADCCDTFAGRLLSWIPIPPGTGTTGLGGGPATCSSDLDECVLDGVRLCRFFLREGDL